MKDKILHYFNTDRSFATGKVLYNTLPGNSKAFSNSLNRMNETAANLEVLHYQLGKLVGITERQIAIIKRNAITVVDAVIENKTVSAPADSIVIGKPVFSTGVEGNKERLAFVQANGIEVPSKKNKDLDAAIDAWWLANKDQIQAEATKAIAVSTFLQADEQEKKAVKLFDRFPFLSNDNCPVVFKTLVGELGATYRKYKEAHAKLFEDLTQAERLEAAKDVVTPYTDNKAIWAEFEHYQTKGEFLGEYDLVTSFLRVEEIKAMTGEQLATLKHNLTTNINRNKKDLESLEGVKADKKVKLISKQEEELRIVEVELKAR